MKKSLWQAGMSLPEVMIGGAMLAGLALVGAEMFKQQSQAEKYGVVRSELDAFHGNVVRILADYHHCNANLYSSFGAGSITTASLPATTLVQCCPAAGCAISGTQCQNGFTFAGNTSPILTKNGDIGTKTAATGFTPTNFQIFDSNGAASISSGGNEIKKGEIRITYTLRGNLAGAKTIIKKVPIQLKFTASGGFVSCVDAETSTKNTLQKELCNGLDQNLVVYNPVNDKCERKVTSTTHTCPTGEVLIGIDSNGQRVCQPAKNAFDESQAINPADASGCNSANVKFTWDSATNTIKVECL